MRYYVIAGEASGDLHGANLIKQLIKQDSQASFRCWGGDLMKAQGVELVKHYHELAFMGFAEVVANLRTILNNISFCKEDISAFNPDALILIDYPGFNMRIAEFAKKAGFKVLYYISPQVWAWKQSRVKKIKASVDALYCILPFEKDFYKKHNYQVEFVGHPLLDALDDFSLEKGNSSEFIAKHGLVDKPIIALLPGSRQQEIKRMLPIMLSVLEFYPNVQFVVAAASSQPRAYFDTLLKDSPWVNVVYGKTYELLSHAHAALVTSGTATLETALFNVPQVVCYKAGAISYQIAKRLVKTEYISLVNLVMGEEVVSELIQGEFNTENLKSQLDQLLNNDKRKAISLAYKELKIKLGGAGASERTARLMLKTLH